MTETRTGSIYKIICSKSNDVYVGSTFNAPRTRMSQHHSQFKSGSGVAIYPSFKQHGWASLKMILIETYEVVDRRHLEMYETLWFNKLKAINKKVPFQPLSREIVVQAREEAEKKKRKAWYEERKRIYRAYRIPFKYPRGYKRIVQLEESDPLISKVIKASRLPTLKEIIEHDTKILLSQQ
jgi:hypothetical protein